MKLLKLKLYETYRSLGFDEQRFPKLDIIKNEIDPICLVGLNGCGKSNLLELVADIFYFIESELLNYIVARKPYIPYSDNKKRKEIFFEIDYQINVKDKDHFIRITRIPKASKVNILIFQDIKFESLIEESVLTLKYRKFLPLIIAYTSGLNDLLSMPFIELQDYYAREVTHQVKVLKNKEAQIEEPNLLLMDFDSNAAIIVANYLLNNTRKLEIFEKFCRIKNLNSFKIVIQLNKGHNNNKVLLPTEFEKIIEDLKNCSTICNHIPNEKSGDYYELDFLVNDVTKRLFKYYFKSPKKLFTALSKLNLLNTLCVQTGYRHELRTNRKEGKLLRFPTVATLDKIFRIEQIELILSEPRVRTEYIKISDGEHQFIHIVGGMLLYDELKPEREALYLLDEPDTHFNPQWRSDFFKELDLVLENKRYEFILTTHSPFILGDCHGYNVFVFKRDRLTNAVSFERSNYETYGANFSYLLKNMFDFQYQISDKSREHLFNLEKDIQETEGTVTIEKIDYFEKELMLYGESVEKLYVVNQLQKLKENLQKI